jgi:septal ring factor EnvC (AmiA/AmiB activator)
LKRLLVALALICTAAGATLARQPQTSEAAQLTRQAERRIRELQAEADRLAAQTASVLGQLRALEIEREIKAQELKKTEAELASVTTALTDTAARLRALEARRVADTPGMRERLVEIYKRGRSGYVRLLLEAKDMRALGRMTRGVAAVAQLDRLRVEAHRRTIRAERDAVTELEARKKAVAAAQAQASTARLALDRAAAVHNQRLDELDKRRDVAAQYVGELEAAQAELQKRMASLGNDTSALTLPLGAFRGSLEWPISGRILSRFGRNPASRFGTAIVRNGIEIAAPEGQEVRAVHGGTVAYAAPFTGFGTLAIVDHGANAFTLYGHLAEALVKPGTRVNRGTILGRAGRSPAGEQAVYFELRIDGRPVDPVQWLRSIR